MTTESASLLPRSGGTHGTSRVLRRLFASFRRRRLRLLSLASIVAFLVLWQVVATYLVSPFFLSSPTTIALALVELAHDGTLQSDAYSSLTRILAGWIIGSAVAVPIGLAVGASGIVKAAIDPFIHFFRFIPSIALITLFIVWFGVGEESKVGLIIYATGFIVMVNTSTGVVAIPEDKLNAARCLGASEWQVFLHVVVPATVPYIFTGMRLAMASSYLVIVGAEIIAANSGLGYLVWVSRLYFHIDWMFAGVIAIGAFGFITDRLWRLLGRTLLKRYTREAAQY